MAMVNSSDSAEDRLRRIEAVTDTTLAHLGVEQLLQELLARVREILGTDTATVLLLADGGQHLVATASSGLEESVRQGVRIPVGEGFAGRIAQRRERLVMQEITSTTVRNPILWQKGVHSLAGVPLLAGGELIGVLHVGSMLPRDFTDQDLQLLELAADRVALATRTRQARVERAAAAALQRNLLPARLPRIIGMELASRYVPAEEAGVSGDWYDVFTLPSGWLCVAIGDVVGRGLTAATVMSRMRTATRAYALDSNDPSEVLSKLDSHMRHFEPDAMATIAYGMWEPSLERLHISLAGHLAPVLAAPGDPAAPAELPVDPPIGAGSAPLRRRTSTITVAPGTMVLFYTDGLVERRHRPLEVGLQLICDAMRTDSAEAMCAAVMSKLIDADPTGDDIAVLAIRRQTAEELRRLELEFSAVPDSLSEIRAALRRWLPTVGASDDDIADLLVAVGEASANVVEHAYGPLGGTVELHLAANDREVIATVKDNGSWRPPRGQHRGRGTQLMQHLSDDVRFEHGPDGTSVQIRRHLTGGKFP
ncbi:ATP-binding SpoIIE family protein phosphatase [Qaidamihabitans albus]|uniref:ATP-binding SpoIIE family protein phosphatase n=1 Tax=Qaidamihabitans albus TaxID=2795733 RepID=UPI001F158349|nr:SpoIIE family protein phosphatase [Qaidamihabitans albus]